MPNPVAVCSSYPKNNLLVPTVLCISTADDQISAADISTIQNLGCATDQVIPSFVNDSNELNLSAMETLSQFRSINQSPTKSIKIGTLSSLESIQAVHSFLRSIPSTDYLVIVDLTKRTSSSNELLWTMRDLILPLCNVLIITYDNAVRLLTLSQPALEDIACHVAVLGPRIMVVENEEGQRFVMLKKNENLSETSSFWLPHQGNIFNQEVFSAAVAAYMTYEKIPPSYAIYFAHHYSMADEHFRSFVLRIQPFTFTQELWSSVHSTYNRILELPFLTKMLDGTLAKLIYDYYVIQDYIFLLDRGRMLQGLISQCTNDDVCQFFQVQLDRNNSYVGKFFSENEVSPQDEADVKKMPACDDYTKLMLQLAQPSESCGWQEGLVALLPCTLVYAKVGDWMIASGQRPTVKRYANFIDSYYSQAKRDRLINFLELTDRVIGSCSHEKRHKLKKLFQQVCEYEYAFWNDAYLYGMQGVNQMNDI